MDFVDDYGYINSRPDEKGGENSLLFTVENILINQYLNDNNGRFGNYVIQGLEKQRLNKGIYSQTPANDLSGHDCFMSLDQLTAIFAISKVFDLDHSKDIWKEIKRQKFRYDNVNPENPSWKRIMHPRDVIYFGLCEGSKLWYLLLPLLVAMSVWSCVRKYKVRGERKFIATDSKLLTFVRFVPFRKNFIMKPILSLMTTIIGKNFKNGWKEVFSVYFAHENHPNNTIWDK